MYKLYEYTSWKIKVLVLLQWDYIYIHWLYSPFEPWPLLFSFMITFTDRRTPWTSDQLVAGPLLKHRTTQTHNKHIHTPNIYTLCGTRTHDPSCRASEDSSCLRPLGYCDRHIYIFLSKWPVERKMETLRINDVHEVFPTDAAFQLVLCSPRVHPLILRNMC
jgi:hypothetical protein